MSQASTLSEIPTITPTELYGKVQRGEAVEVIDVRTPAEYREVHATVARLVPLDALNPAEVARERTGAADSPLYVICRSGNRAKSACEKLRAAGLTNLVNVAGGTVAWEQAGLPVVRGKKTISLERQVRICAGALVVIGSALAVLVHPYWAGLSGFIGAGLVFAGVTDTCGMAMMLAKMPWNQAGGSATTCSRS
jgi:rhodanese-related sulfurtransferase